MKKILLSIAVLLLTIFYVNAQSFYLEWNGEALSIDTTITIVPETSTSTEIVFDAIFHNNTNNGVNIKVVRNEIQLMEGSVNYFCWDTCYESSVDSSVSYKYIPGGSSSVLGDFVAYYEINGTVGISNIEYIFYNLSNPDTYASVTVNFETYPAGVDDNMLTGAWLSDIYPNPATRFVNVDYDIPINVEEASVKIVNMFGMVVKEQELDTGSSHMRMNISELSGGVYFFTLFVNGDVYRTKKLIIR